MTATGNYELRVKANVNTHPQNRVICGRENMTVVDVRLGAFDRMPTKRLLLDWKLLQICGFAIALGVSAPITATAQDSAASAGFRQAIAEMAWEDEAVAGFYRSNGFKALWTGSDTS
ncbi:MAG: hypothetical protein MJH10_06535, partial [Epibacterium sp.]|nr:hypothetical protein [Epibacterium sp.]